LIFTFATPAIQPAAGRPRKSSPDSWSDDRPDAVFAELSGAGPVRRRASGDRLIAGSPNYLMAPRVTPDITHRWATMVGAMAISLRGDPSVVDLIAGRPSMP
jgi:hypothetical protein